MARALTDEERKEMGLAPKKYTTKGKNPRSLPAGSGPPSLAELNRKTSSEKATPEGGRRGFMAGMTGTTKKKNLNRMDADPAREPLQDPGIARGMEIRRKEIEKARKYQADQRAKKTAPVKKAATGKTKIPDLSGSSMGSKAPVPFPKKKDTTPYVPPIYPDAEGEDFAKRMRKNYANKGKAAAPTATGPKWKQYKSVAAAKKAGSKYYMGKDGKKKAALYKGDLDKSLSKRDAYNKALGLKRADGSAVEKAKPKKDAKKDTKKKSFRERRAERLKDRLASESVGEGRKKRIKRRLSRVEGRIEKAKKDKKEEKARKPKKYATGGLAPTTGGIGSGIDRYYEGGKKGKSKPKLKGWGITQKAIRPAKMR